MKNRFETLTPPPSVPHRCVRPPVVALSARACADLWGGVMGGDRGAAKTFAPLYTGRRKFREWVGRRAKLFDRAHCRPEVVRTRRDGAAVPTRPPGATAVSRAHRPPLPAPTMSSSYIVIYDNIVKLRQYYT